MRTTCELSTVSGASVQLLLAVLAELRQAMETAAGFAPGSLGSDFEFKKSPKVPTDAASAARYAAVLSQWRSHWLVLVCSFLTSASREIRVKSCTYLLPNLIKFDPAAIGALSLLCFARFPFMSVCVCVCALCAPCSPHVACA